VKDWFIDDNQVCGIDEPIQAIWKWFENTKKRGMCYSQRNLLLIKPLWEIVERNDDGLQKNWFLAHFKILPYVAQTYLFHQSIFLKKYKPSTSHIISLISPKDWSSSWSLQKNCFVSLISSKRLCCILCHLLRRLFCFLVI
jgi:hypothetical protein